MTKTAREYSLVMFLQLEKSVMRDEEKHIGR